MTMRFPLDDDAPARARRWLAGQERARTDARSLEHAALLLSELVTNVVRHSGSAPETPIEVRVTNHEGCLHVDVVDAGVGFAPGAQPAREGHYGLRLVSELADRWGVDGSEPNVAWFEIDVEARA
jgi:anti-sigma regulatory factor (Ser/Thr protein kinase)